MLLVALTAVAGLLLLFLFFQRSGAPKARPTNEISFFHFSSF
jgi:hypothetical protein